MFFNDFSWKQALHVVISSMWEITTQKWADNFCCDDSKNLRWSDSRIKRNYAFDDILFICGVWRLQTLGSFGGSFFTDGWRPKKGISKKWLLFLQIITLLLPGGVAQRGESWSGQRVVTFNKNIIYNFGYSFSHRHPILIEFQFCTGLLVVGIKFIQPSQGSLYFWFRSLSSALEKKETRIRTLLSYSVRRWSSYLHPL